MLNIFINVEKYYDYIFGKISFKGFNDYSIISSRWSVLLYWLYLFVYYFRHEVLEMTVHQLFSLPGSTPNHRPHYPRQFLCSLQTLQLQCSPKTSHHHWVRIF